MSYSLTGADDIGGTQVSLIDGNPRVDLPSEVVGASQFRQCRHHRERTEVKVTYEADQAAGRRRWVPQ